MNKVIRAGFVFSIFLIAGPAMAQVQDIGIYGIDRMAEPYGGKDRRLLTIRTDDPLAPYAFGYALRDPLWPVSRNSADASRVKREEVSVAYGWRNVSVEGALFTDKEVQANWLRIGPEKSVFASSRRLSLSSHNNWTFQLSRGRMSRADQLDPSDGIKRTTIASIYQYPFDHARWQTTLAYGRSGKKADGTVGHAYLFESLMQIRRAHIVFIRAERALADELFPEREALPEQSFNANRYTLGYVYNVPSTNLTKLTIGGLASKRTVPFDHLETLGRSSVDYKVFIRLSMPMR